MMTGWLAGLGQMKGARSGSVPGMTYLVRSEFGVIDPPEWRGPEGRFGGLWQFGGVRGVGTRDWAARESLCGERGCEGELVAREGRDGRGVGGGGGGAGGGGGGGRCA